MVKAYIIRCPTCGGRVSATEKICEYCGNAVALDYSINFATIDSAKLGKHISQYESIDGDFEEKDQTLALCYIRLKQYKKAIAVLDNAINNGPQNPDFYFLKAISLLQGQKPFNVHLSDIKDALNNLNSAVMIENKGIFRFTMAYIKYDFYKRKFLRISPSYEDELKLAKANGFALYDLQKLQGLLIHQIPEILISQL